MIVPMYLHRSGPWILVQKHPWVNVLPIFLQPWGRNHNLTYNGWQVTQGEKIAQNVCSPFHFCCQWPLVPLLLLGPPFFPIILFESTTLLTRMTGISLHLQWPLTSQLHGSVSQREWLFFSLWIQLHALSPFHIIETVSLETCSPKNWAYFKILKYLSRDNNCPNGENSPSMISLQVLKISAYLHTR
jgi:hypothetical protein